MQNKSILIAGATGFVGQALVPYLMDKGYDVKILTRNISTAKKVFPHNVAIYKWPEGNEKALLGTNKGCEAIINLVGANIGEKRWTKNYKNKILSSRVNSVKNIEELVKLMPNKPKVWVQASAIGYFGDDNNAGRASGFLANVVKQWETVFKAVQIKGLRKVTLRFGVVLSQQSGMLHQMKKVFNMGVAVCPGNGKQIFSWIHIEDLVSAIYQSIINEDWHGDFNAVAPNALSMWDFTKQLQTKTKAVIALKIPAFVFQLFLGKEKANELMLASQHVLPTKLLKNNFKYRFQYFIDTLED
ncbi:MAG: TIGR01777 family oxidoreductase [Salinivirgaceae bacterium]|jgi:uncharacterized protein (TIGR01777 family)|nr:TIGR01777 family oxidoreductase [Salinivirgaceae bacterium]